MSFQTGGSGYGAPTPQTTPPTTSKGPAVPLAAATAGLGVLNFLLGFTPFVEIDGIAHFGSSGASQNFFESGSSSIGLSFMLFSGLLAGLSLLPKLEAKAAAAAAAVVGFLSLLVVLFTIPDGLTLDYGAWLVVVLSAIQSILAVGALLADQGIIKAPVPKPATAGFGPGGQGQGGFGQGGPGFGYGQAPTQQSGQSGPYGQGQHQQQQYPAYGQSPQSGYGAQQSQQQYPAYGQNPQQQYGQPPVQQQQPQAGYSGYAAPAQATSEPAPQYQPPVQGSTGPTYGSSLNYGATPSPSQHAAPESDATQAFRASAEDDEK